jgi:tetratricopeptide (TPR) repeat protein
MDPFHFIYFFKRGTLYLKQEYLTEAEADFTAAIELNPKHHNSLHNRGIVRYKLGQESQACEDWCEALTLGNEYSRSHLALVCNNFDPCQPDK